MANNSNEEETSKNDGINNSIYYVSFSFSIISFLLPVYSKRIGANAFEIGILFSVFSFVTLLLRPIIGWAIDKFGRRKFFVLSLLFYAFAMLLFSTATSIKWLYLARTLQGIGSSILWTTAYTLASDLSSEKDKGKIMGMINEISSRGSFIGAIIGFIALGMMTLMTGWKVIFSGYAVLAAIAAIIAWKRVPDIKSTKEVTDRKVLLNSDFVKIVFIILISSIGSSMLNPMLMIYLQDKFTTDISMLAIASIPAAIIISILPSKTGRFSDKVGRILPLEIGYLICGISSILIINATNLYMLVAFWAIEAIGIALLLPAEQAIISDITGKNLAGTGYGIYMFASGIGNVAGPILGGVLYENYLHEMPFYICGILLVVSSFLTLILFRKNKFLIKPDGLI
ncbi:MAG: MFS transporter [Clostridiaceae bacterium]